MTEAAIGQDEAGNCLMNAQRQSLYRPSKDVCYWATWSPPKVTLLRSLSTVLRQFAWYSC